MKLGKLILNLILSAGLLIPALTLADTPKTIDGVTTIHLTEYNGYFSSPETLVKLKPGKYKFIIKNESGKLVGFWLQDAKSHKFLDKFPIEKGETRTTDVVYISENGFRYRCPINPTPWYDVGVDKS